MKRFKILKIMVSLLALSLLAGCGSQAVTPLPAAVGYTGAPTSSSNSIIIRGVVESALSRNVYTALGFTIDRVYAEVGDYVAVGQVLAQFDSSDLELTIAQQRANLELARQNSQNLVADSQRLLNEASANLANNTNAHILSAEASLNTAAANLETARTNHNNTLRDYSEGSDGQVLSAESALQSARIERSERENTHRNLYALYAAGALSREELRLSETALEIATNIYNTALSNYENAVTAKERNLRQSAIALESAITAHKSAAEMLRAARTSASQDIERLRSNANNAEVAANLEHMEIALQILERQLEDSVIRAPINGTVTAAIAREGAVGMGLLFVVEDTEDLRIATSFREYDISRIDVGMEVIITSDGTGVAEYSGIISRINPAANPNSPIVEFEAEISVTSPNTNLRIGMNTRVEVGGR